ncbi:MAG: hypothetical protein K0Q59_3566, partial [Paenibacillus sp.]|nr:hypothetical protein [Paenibacillus sp.]
EGRFPAGKANLSTSALAYGAYVQASQLAVALGRSTEAVVYQEKAAQLGKAIEHYFGQSVEGFDTYRYFAGCMQLRSWICVPLTVGLLDRKDETMKALYSEKLWTDNGVFVESGKPAYWDRGTLYTLRAGFRAGERAETLRRLQSYSKQRLLGDHVPYMVEAYPEGNGRHLSAESALYCRIYIEGLFGIAPNGLEHFSCDPQLPDDWDRMALRAISIVGGSWDLEVFRADGEETLVVRHEGERRTFKRDDSGVYGVHRNYFNMKSIMKG